MATFARLRSGSRCWGHLTEHIALGERHPIGRSELGRKRWSYRWRLSAPIDQLIAVRLVAP